MLKVQILLQINSLVYETVSASGNEPYSYFSVVRRGEFEQRVSNNPIVDNVPEYDIFNITVGIDFMNRGVS